MPEVKIAKINYVLVDHENVSIEDISALKGEHVRLIVFVGSTQKKLSADAVMSIHKMGNKAEYVQMSGSGPNALDFHLAFYLGRLAQLDQNAFFHVVSKDKGFDPLIAHLSAQDIQAERVDSVRLIALIRSQRMEDEKTVAAKARVAAPTPHATKANLGDTAAVKAAIQQSRMYHQKYLCVKNTTKPSKLGTLQTSIHSFFKKELDVAQVNRIILGLQTKGCLRFDGEKTIWSIP
jgi:PIN domain